MQVLGSLTKSSVGSKRLTSLADTWCSCRFPGGRTSKLLEATWGCSWKSRNGGCGMHSSRVSNFCYPCSRVPWCVTGHAQYGYGYGLGKLGPVAYQNLWTPRPIFLLASRSAFWVGSPKELCWAIFSLVLLATVHVPAEAIVTLVPSSISGPFCAFSMSESIDFRVCEFIFSSIISCCLSSDLVLILVLEKNSWSYSVQNSNVIDLIALQVLVISTYIMVFFATVTQADSDSWAAARNPKHLAGMWVSMKQDSVVCAWNMWMDALFLQHFPWNTCHVSFLLVVLDSKC